MIQVVTHGKTLDEVTKNMREAMGLHLRGEAKAKCSFLTLYH